MNRCPHCGFQHKLADVCPGSTSGWAVLPSLSSNRDNDSGKELQRRGDRAMLTAEERRARRAHAKAILEYHWGSENMTDPEKHALAAHILSLDRDLERVEADRDAWVDAERARGFEVAELERKISASEAARAGLRSAIEKIQEEANAKSGNHSWIRLGIYEIARAALARDAELK